MVISFDLDEILSAFQNGWIIFNQEKYNHHLVFEDIDDYDYTKVMKLSEEEIFRRLFEFYASDTFKQVLPVTGAIETVEKLSKDHTLYVLTSRSEDIRGLTEDWITKYFPGMFKEVLFSSQVSKDGYNHKVTKADICKQFSIKLHIDDAPIYAEPIANAGVKVILVDKPWNRNYTISNPLISRILDITKLPEAIT